MNEAVSKSDTLLASERLALAQAAFQEFHSRCFWFMRPDAQLTEEDLPYVSKRLRADGGRRVSFWPRSYGTRKIVP